MTDNLETGSVQTAGLTDSQIIEQRIEAKLSGEQSVKPVESSEPVEVESTEVAEVIEEAEPEVVSDPLSFESVEDLAEALDMPLDDFLAKIQGTVKIDGKESELSW